MSDNAASPLKGAIVNGRIMERFKMLVLSHIEHADNTFDVLAEELRFELQKNGSKSEEFLQILTDVQTKLSRSPALADLQPQPSRSPAPDVQLHLNTSGINATAGVTSPTVQLASTSRLSSLRGRARDSTLKGICGGCGNNTNVDAETSRCKSCSVVQPSENRFSKQPLESSSISPISKSPTPSSSNTISWITSDEALKTLGSRANPPAIEAVKEYKCMRCRTTKKNGYVPTFGLCNSCYQRRRKLITLDCSPDDKAQNRTLHCRECKKFVASSQFNRKFSICINCRATGYYQSPTDKLTPTDSPASTASIAHLTRSRSTSLAIQNDLNGARSAVQDVSISSVNNGEDCGDRAHCSNCSKRLAPKRVSFGICLYCEQKLNGIDRQQDQQPPMKVEIDE